MSNESGKNIKFGIVLSYAIQVVQIATALVYTPVMLRLLGKSEYGLYQLVNSVVSYLSLLSLGFGNAYVRFYFKGKTEGGLKKVSEVNGMFMTVFIVISIVCLICGELMIINIHALFGSGLTSDEYEVAKVLMQLMVINIALTFPMSVYNGYITAHEKFIAQKIILLIGNIANPFLCLPLLISGLGSISLISITLFINSITFIVIAIYCKKNLDIRFSFHNLQFRELKEVWSFTFFLFLNQIIDQINWNVDKYLLGRFTGTGGVAVYGIASQINTLYISVSTSISSVFAPRVNKLIIEDKDYKASSNLFIRVGRLQFMVMLLILSGFICFGQRFINLWAGTDYSEAYPVALLLIIPVTVPLIENIGIEIQRAMNKHQVRSVVYAFVAISNVLVSIPLTKRYGPVGAAAGTCITMVAGNIIFMNWYYQKHLSIDIREFIRTLRRFVPLIIYGTAITILLRGYFETCNLWIYLLGIALYSLIYLLLLFIIVLQSSERNYFIRKLKFK